MDQAKTRPSLDKLVEQHESETGLHRHLSNRHIQLIAIGGAIGTGLFMGSGRTIHSAGPSVLFVYMIIGFVLFFVMRAMGEVLLTNHNYGNFSDFVSDIVGPGWGFAVGWTYWLCWIVTGVADVVAIVGYLHFWWPTIPPWIPALLCVALLFSLNALTVKSFGETEFWFSMIKIVAIIALIACGVVMVVIGFTSPDGTQAHISNLWSHKGANGSGVFPNGIWGFLGGFQLAIFSFVGIELVGTTAAETQDPDKSLPKAINSIPIRIILFYVCALAAIMMVTPWDRLDPDSSPFVGLFHLVGMGAAAGIVNLVVLTSAASSCNSGIYSTSRMMFGLASRSDAPGFFKKLSRHRVPLRALGLSCLILLISIPLMSMGGSVMEIFTLVTSVSAVLYMFIWAMITIAYVIYRIRRPQGHEKSHFKMPGGYASAAMILVFLVLMVVVLGLDPSTLRAELASFVWFALLGIAVYFNRKTSRSQRIYADFRERVIVEKTEAAIYRGLHK